jgi:hypothetical protein
MSTVTETYQTNIPKWAEPYAKPLLGRAEALTDTGQNPYTPYGGQRQAGFNPLQQQAFGGIASLGPSAVNPTAMNFTGQGGIAGLMAGGNYNAMATNPNAVGAFMSPYMANVVNRQKLGAIEDYGRSIPGMGANAARVGALGGTRNALVQAEGERNLFSRLGDIEAKGLQDAYGAGLQSLQFGSNLGLQGANTGIQAGSTLSQQGNTEFDQYLRSLTAQNTAGKQIQDWEQGGLEQKYQQFLDELNYPYKQLMFMSDILRGTPATAQTRNVYETPPSLLNQVTGAGMTAYGLGSLFTQNNQARP